MIPKDKQRRIEALVNGEWVACDMGHLEAGDVFRVFEADGLPVTDLNGRTQWTVDEQPAIKTRDEPVITKRTLNLSPFTRTYGGLSEDAKVRLNAITDEDIAEAVASDPDAAPLATEEDFKSMTLIESKG